MDILVVISILLIIVLIILINNKIIRLKNKVKQSESTIDVYLSQRFDLIPNLVECVQGYMKYEKDVLEKIIRERSEYINDFQKDLTKASYINSECNYIIAVAEKYPELKASEQFLNLQKALSKIENQIQAARRLFNSDVTIYNTNIKTFPINIIAIIFNHREEKLFEIQEFKRENIDINIQ